MVKPRKEYTPEKHHLPTEEHKLNQHDFVILSQIRTAQLNLQSAESNLLAGIAREKWHYPIGLALEFTPDFEKATVSVTILKENSEISNNQDLKE